MALETQRLRTEAAVTGIDEVGRGALAGPVVVGAVTVHATRSVPEGLDDSKRLSPRRRSALVPEILQWADEVALGAATSAEVDKWGILPATGLAAQRALAQLRTGPGLVLIDGNIDLLTRSPLAASKELPEFRTELIIGGDRSVAVIAAASVIAKVARDALMGALDRVDARFHWSENKGYGSSAHREAILTYGATAWHRRTWSLTSPIV
jgi:ribonuclease HII